MCVVADQSLPLYLRLSECLLSTQLQLDWRRLCLDEDLSQLAQMLHSLTDQHMFDTAFKFALIAGLPCDNVLVTQVRNRGDWVAKINYILVDY